MSQQLARRTGTVGALVAAASMTMVAGVWPALGVASATEGVPAQVKDGTSGADAAHASAPGQVKKDVPVSDAPVTAAPVEAAPVTAAPVEAAPVAAAPVAAAPQADAPGQVKKTAPVEPAAPVPAAPQADAPAQVKKIEPAPVAETTATAPTTTETTTTAPTTTETTTTDAAPTGPATRTTTGPATGTSKAVGPATGAAQPGPAAKESKPKAVAPVVGPSTGTTTPSDAPVVGPSTGVAVTGPVRGAGRNEKAKPDGSAVGPQAVPAPAAVSDAPGRSAQAPERDKEPAQPAPHVGPVVEAPVAAHAPRPVKVGPVVPLAVRPAPAAAVAPGRVGPAAPVAVPAPAAKAPASWRPMNPALIGAADPLPLRPAGAVALPTVVVAPARPALDVNLTHALPALATGTAQAVAQTPELPLGIAAVVVLFLLLQSRIDRRDPKLATVRLEDDAPLEFPEAGQVHLRLVTAA